LAGPSCTPVQQAPSAARRCGSSVVGEGGERARIEAILAEGGCRSSPGCPASVTTFRDPARTRRVRAAVVRRGRGRTRSSKRVGRPACVVSDAARRQRGTGRRRRHRRIRRPPSDPAALGARRRIYADVPGLGNEARAGGRQRAEGPVRARSHDRALPIGSISRSSRVRAARWCRVAIAGLGAGRHVRASRDFRHPRPARGGRRACFKRMNTSQAHRGPDGERRARRAGRRASATGAVDHHVATGSSRSTTRTAASSSFSTARSKLPVADPGAGRARPCIHTKSDNEVIVHAWEAWGERCVERFRGMFAFALVDRNRRDAVLAATPRSQDSLYYAPPAEGRCWFERSELKSLLATAGSRATIDPHAIEVDHSRAGLRREPDARSFPGARKLPPAHTLAIRAASRCASRPATGIRASRSDRVLTRTRSLPS